MKIKSADFVMSNSSVASCPADPLPEYAFIGRSNVGKTSGRPGKTQLINHFKINNNWFLVDLPGYGYARVSKKDKKTFQKYITDYFLERKQLLSAFVLIDIRHEPQPIDLNFMAWLGEKQIPFSIVFTKADKLKPNAITRQVKNYLKVMTDEMWEEAPQHFVTSSLRSEGRDDILNYIDQINSDYFSQQG